MIPLVPLKPFVLDHPVNALEQHCHSFIQFTVNVIFWKQLLEQCLELLLLAYGCKHLDMRKVALELLSRQIKKILQISAQHFPSFKLIFVAILQNYTLAPVRIADPPLNVIKDCHILIPVVLFSQRPGIIPKQEFRLIAFCCFHSDDAWDDRGSVNVCDTGAAIWPADAHCGVGAPEINYQRKVNHFHLLFPDVQKRNLDPFQACRNYGTFSVITVIQEFGIPLVWKVQ